MSKLIATVGLPGSGKSTWSVAYQKEHGGRIVCKDDIRTALTATGWVWSRDNEKEVIAERDKQIRAYLKAGLVTISCDTNFGKHTVRLAQLAKECRAEFEIKDFADVPLDVCVERDATRDKPVGVDVIKRMYNEYIAPNIITPYISDLTKPNAIICDLDGTLALHAGKRSPYEYLKLMGDEVNEPIAQIIKKFQEDGTTVIFLSGRDDSCRDLTINWLDNNEFWWDKLLFMRKAGDNRKDYVMKKELFDEHIRNNYNVLFCLDDRDQVVKLWREMGLTCLQVAYGAF